MATPTITTGNKIEQTPAVAPDNRSASEKMPSFEQSGSKSIRLDLATHELSQFVLSRHEGGVDAATEPEPLTASREVNVSVADRTTVDEPEQVKESAPVEDADLSANITPAAIEAVDKVDKTMPVRPAKQLVHALPDSVAMLTDVSNLPESQKSHAGTIPQELLSAVPRYGINPAPVYPDIALRKGWEGVVLLKVDVMEDGSVERVVIETSSGFQALDRSALKAVRRWQFVPAMSAGMPVAGGALIPINFDLP